MRECKMNRRMKILAVEEMMSMGVAETKKIGWVLRVVQPSEVEAFTVSLSSVIYDVWYCQSGGPGSGSFLPRKECTIPAVDFG